MQGIFLRIYLLQDKIIHYAQDFFSNLKFWRSKGYKDVQYLIWKIRFFSTAYDLKRTGCSTIRMIYAMSNTLILLHEMAVQPFWLDLTVSIQISFLPPQ